MVFTAEHRGYIWSKKKAPCKNSLGTAAVQFNISVCNKIYNLKKEKNRQWNLCTIDYVLNDQIL